jgi:hypothetical protein
MTAPPPRDWAAHAAALQNDDDSWQSLWQAPPAQQPRPPEEAPPLLFSAATVKVNYFGVGADSAYLKPTGIGMKRGTTGTAEYTFSKLVSCDISENPLAENTLGSFVDYIIKQQLGGSVADLCSQEIKVIKVKDGAQESASPFEMFGLDAPIALEHKSGVKYNIKLVLFLRAKPLCRSRAQAAAGQWADFKEGAAAEGIKLSAAKLAGLVGLGEATIKKAISTQSQQDGNVRAE